MKKIFQLLDKHSQVFLSIIFCLVLIFSFSLSLRRYQNYEFGKFDLGNMAQMVYNTTRLKPMLVTDQFGTNMPRSGMSHVDPALMLIAPLYIFISHPMLLVFLQHALLLSVIFPIYKLSKKFSRNILFSYLFIFLYLSNTILGYTLVWTAFHGISFVAPVIIWLIFFLDTNNFLNKNPSLRMYITYWSLITFILSGKEQIGLLVAIGCIFLFFKNWKLATQTAIYSILWFITAFLIIIPANSHLRQESINNLVKQLNLDPEKAESASKDNFFIQRYEYLGTSYGEIITNVLIKPELVLDKAITNEKLMEMYYIFGSSGFVQILNPFWLVGLPDHLINFLAKSDDIYSINNHRSTILFIINIVSLLYFFKYLIEKYNVSDRFINIFIIIILAHSMFLNVITKNPLFKPIIEKIALASEGKVKYRLPENTVRCLDESVKIINKYNPSSYSGPDYLGAHTANREINALFPANYKTANLLAIDMYDTKAITPLGYENDWFVNRRIMNEIFSNNQGKIVYSCDKLTLFINNDTERSNIEQIESIPQMRNLNVDDIKFELSDLTLINENNQKFYEIVINKNFNGDINSYIPYFTFENKLTSKRYNFVDYYLIFAKNSINEIPENTSIKYKIDAKRFDLPDGDYNIMFGIANRIDGVLTQIGSIEIKN